MKKILNYFCFFWAKLKYLISKNPECLNKFYRKNGAKIGANCLICTPILAFPDNCLLEIGNDVVISTNVIFILHDYSASRVVKGISNLHGKIIIGNNCFIGSGAILMYGVELAENTIVAAGSVVTKSFSQKNIIIGGNPAKIIGTWEKFREKVNKYGNNFTDINDLINNHPEYLVKK